MNLSYLQCTTMNRFFALLLFIFTGLFGLSAQQPLYQESFEKVEGALIRELNNQYNQGEIKGGKYHWKYSGKAPHALTSYANRLDPSANFTVEIRLKSFMSGSEYGLMWGGNSPQNAHCVLGTCS